MPLDTTARREGFRAMQRSISRAANVRRKLKGGRPRKVQSLELTPYGAMDMLITHADRAASLMTAAGLDPADLRLGLVIRVGVNLMCKVLPPSSQESLRQFFDAIEGLTSPRFLGVVFEQLDREAADGAPPFTTWIIPFTAEPEDQAQLLALKASIAASGARLN